MNETIREMDSAFFFTPEYKDIFKYHREYSDEGEMLADGVFLDNIGYYRFFEVEYLDTKGFLPMAVNVDFDAHVYATTVKGARIDISLRKAVDLATKAYGMDFNNIDDVVDFIRKEATGELTAYFENDVMPAYIDEEGRQVFYDRVMTHIYACLVDRFGDITPVECPYISEQKTYTEGQSVLIDWDNSKFSEVSTAIGYANQDNYVAYPYDKIYEQLQNFAETDDDIKAILQCSNIRTYVKGTNNYIHYSICGWTIDNNTIVTTDHDEYQDYGLTVTSMRWVRFTSSTSYIYQDPPIWPTFTIYQRGTWTGAQGITINNKRTNYSWLNAAGFPRQMAGPGGLEDTFYYWDSMGFVGEVKPYEVTGKAPNTQSLAERYPEYPKSGNDYPVGEPDPDEPTDQDYIWRGVPEPNPPIPPVIGAPPQRRPDVDGDETLPDVGAVEGVYGLFTVYKASVTDLLNLGSFLWQDDTITSLLNIFKNDPMQAIISLHQLYFDPSAPNSRALKLGTVQVKNTAGGDMTLPFINDRYQRLACGFVKINRYFNDIRDYQTKISIYLPFIGIRELDINEMLDATVFTDYYVDTYTGDCVATISITRDNSTTKKVLAMYNGNCASPLPLTGADKSRLFANIASIGAGLVSTIATKGATAGGLINSVMNTATSHNITIEKSGSMGGNWGAMGYKKPYFIIERPQTYDAVQKAKIIGYGANLTTSLAQMRGFVRVSAVHVDNIPGATDIEKARIEQLLKEGIFL